MSEINLTTSELTRLEAEIQAEIRARLGDEPTIRMLQAQGYRDARQWVTATLDAIGGAGRVLTLFVAEFAQAFAALALAIVFILLEAERIASGAVALGQAHTQAVLLAVAFTVANAVLPLYRLRNVKDRESLIRTRGTLRGYLESFWRRLIWKPQTYTVDVYDNPTLAIMESAVTYATLFLAFFAVLGPMLARYSTEAWYNALWLVISQSNISQMIELVAGALLSIGGVFGVQSISWEFGVRTIADRPARLTDTLEVKRGEYQAESLTIREAVRARFEAAATAEREHAERLDAIRQQAKAEALAELEAERERQRIARKQAREAAKRQPVITPIEVPEPERSDDFLAAEPPVLTVHRNGNGKHHTTNGA